ncbi:MAG: HAMP domain-containing protein [Clostridia bacterium]|nr:HAMP domain-containing protein [Clostridia bacterium]
MRFTIVATYIVVILITLVLMIIYTLGVLSDKLYNSEFVDMFTKANIISENVSQIWENDISVTQDKYSDYVENSLSGTNIRGVITNTSYNILYDTNKESELIGKVFVRDTLKNAMQGMQTSYNEKTDSGQRMISVAVPVKNNEEIIGCVYLAQNIGTIDTTVAATRTGMVVFSVLIVLLIGLLSVGMSYIITSPIEQFRKAAREISKGNFSIRMKVSGHNELAQMSETFNYMCEELDSFEEQRRKFVSDASHELKTPMAGIKLICDSIINAENIDMQTVKEFLSDMSDEVDRLTRIIERLLTLTRLNNDTNALKLEETELQIIIDSVIRKITGLAEEKDIVVYADYAEDTHQPIALDYDRIYEAIYNIVDNAVKYTPNGGFVHIDLKNESHFARIDIEDNGPGIPEGERDKIFERFYRLDDSRARDTGGTGLGLAITKEAILMHGGTIEVNNSEQGGSIFTIRLPYAQDSTEGLAV